MTTSGKFSGLSGSGADIIGYCVGFKTALTPLTVEIMIKRSYIDLYKQITEQDPGKESGKHPERHEAKRVRYGPWAGCNQAGCSG